MKDRNAALCQRGGVFYEIKKHLLDGQGGAN